MVTEIILFLAIVSQQICYCCGVDIMTVLTIMNFLAKMFAGNGNRE